MAPLCWLTSGHLMSPPACQTSSHACQQTNSVCSVPAASRPTRLEAHPHCWVAVACGGPHCWVAVACRGATLLGGSGVQGACNIMLVGGSSVQHHAAAGWQ